VPCLRTRDRLRNGSVNPGEHPEVMKDEFLNQELGEAHRLGLGVILRLRTLSSVDPLCLKRVCVPKPVPC
jgi:hypothetical protein